MKKVILFLCIFFLPLLSAIQINMDSEFDNGETLLADISGVFVEPILKEDISVYRGHVKVPTQLDIIKINNAFYIYVQLLGKEEGNYSLQINNVKYRKGIEIMEENLIKNFTITNKTAYFYFEPGVILTKEDFTIKLQNIHESEIVVDVSSNFTNNVGDSFLLNSGEIKELTFKLPESFESSLQYVYLKSGDYSYDIPVYIIANQSILEKKFRFEPIELSVPLLVNYSNKTKRIVYLHNIGTKELDNITLSMSPQLKPYVIISKIFIDDLVPSENEKIELYFDASNITEEILITGQITATNVDEDSTLYTYLAIFLNATTAYTPLKNETISNLTSTSILKTCMEKGGKICNESQECVGVVETAYDGNCCMGDCRDEKRTSSKKFIGYFLLTLIILFLLWFFFQKYSKTRKTFDLLEKAKSLRRK